MANRYSVLHGNAFERVEAKLAADGYRLLFACTYGEKTPTDFSYTGRENGWEMRRKLKDWCKQHALPQYQIVRNTGYVQDLHGTVYEVWTHIRHDLPVSVCDVLT